MLEKMQSFPNAGYRHKQFERYLVLASLLYLAIPYLIFCLGWLRWYWALFNLTFLAFALYEFMRLTSNQANAEDSPSDPAPPFLTRHIIVLLLLSFLWLSMAGVGGLGYQRGDWVKHESILKDLIEHSWPVIYDFYAVPMPLVYYFAYFLPAAVVGKIGGWGAAQVTLFIWTYAGLNLAMLWFWLLVHKRVGNATPTQSAKVWYSLLLIFIFFSGLDLVGKVITLWAGWASSDWMRLERWAYIFEYSSQTTQLYWVPNQALTGWLATALTIYAILYIRHKRVACLPVALSALGSAFVPLGLAPYLLTELLSDEGTWQARIRPYFSWSSLSALVIIMTVGIFYATKLIAASPYVRAEMPHGFFLSPDPNLRIHDITLFALFGIVEVGIYGFLIHRNIKSESRIWRWLFVTTMLFLVLLPLYKVGIYNDLPMRASIPALFCLLILIGRAIYRHSLGVATTIVLVVCLIIGATTSVIEMRFNLRGIYSEIVGVPFEQLYEERGIVELYQGMPNFFAQYIGAYNSPFFHYLARDAAWKSNDKELSHISFLNQTILFEDYEIEKESDLQPGEQLKLISYLAVFFGSIDKNYNISLRLVAENGEEVWREQGWPENRPTSIWAPSVQWYDTRIITIPTDAKAGIYRLDVSFVNPETHDLLPALAMPSGEYLGEMVPFGYVTVGEVEKTPTYSLPKPAILDDQIALLGMDSAPIQRIAAGESIDLELFWETLSKPQRDYTGFVHLLDAEGKLIAQHDHSPRNGFLPTRLWREGLVISDSYSVVVPSEARPGSYSLVAGMYDLKTGARLPVWQDGQTVGDTILLGQVEVK